MDPVEQIESKFGCPIMDLINMPVFIDTNGICSEGASRRLAVFLGIGYDGLGDVACCVRFPKSIIVLTVSPDTIYLEEEKKNG